VDPLEDEVADLTPWVAGAFQNRWAGSLPQIETGPKGIAVRTMTTATFPHAAPSAIARRTGAPGAATILFADLCGFTEFTWHNGDERAAALATEFHRYARSLSSDEGCNFVKALGDGVMMQAADCRELLRVARRMLSSQTREVCLPIRIGIDHGPAVQHAGDWYGSTVNAAARVADCAAPGELLITERARDALRERTAVPTVARGVRRLKGLPDQPLYAVLAA